jgi:hypothetical protein
MELLRMIFALKTTTALDFGCLNFESSWQMINLRRGVGTRYGARHATLLVNFKHHEIASGYFSNRRTGSFKMPICELHKSQFLLNIISKDTTYFLLFSQNWLTTYEILLFDNFYFNVFFLFDK